MSKQTVLIDVDNFLDWRYREDDDKDFFWDDLIYDLKKGFIATNFFNAANEIAVESFIKDEINFTAIFSIVENVTKLSEPGDPKSIEDVFKSNVKTFSFIKNTLAKDKITNDKWRKYKSPIDSRNLANNVENEVVEALTESVTSNYKNISHRYYKIKAKLFNQEKLNYWDRNAPYPDSPNKKINWSEAKDIVIRSYANFDKSFEDIVLLFFNNSWIDAELKSGKSPGAFAASTIPSIHPYILTNFHGKTRDVMTLAHELGHGCHQYLSAKQGLLLSSTPLTLAETASVFGAVSYTHLRAHET